MVRDRLRVLVLSPETPAFPGSGGQSRQYGLLTALAGRHDIRVLSSQAAPAFGSVPPGVDLRYVPLLPPHGRPAGSWLARNIRHALSGTPRIVDASVHEAESLEPVLAEHMAEFRPDIVQVEHVQLAGLLTRIPASTPTVLVLHNLLSTLQGQLRGDGLRGAAGAALEGLLVRRHEGWVLGAAREVVVVSNGDARVVLRRRPGASVEVVPNCVPVDYFQPPASPATEPVVVMTANFFWPPNQLAARELLTVILPEVRQAVDGAELVLVGQGMPPWLEALVAATAGASATGPVADVRPYLTRARVAAAPLRRGAGSPLKVLEAMAAGVPVVTTARVSSALELPPAMVLTAETPAATAAAIIRLLGNPQLATSMTRQALAMVREKFSWEVAAARLEEVWATASAGSA